MNLLRRFFLVLVIISGGISLNAQDIHFSQFYMSPLNLNPAMTGVMNCNIRLVANYRNQWASVLRSNAFNTYSVSYDQKIAVGRYDYFGVGASFWGDVAGESEFGTLTGKLSASYSKRMGGYRKKAHYLVFGVDGGLAQRSLNFSKLLFPEQILSGLASSTDPDIWLSLDSRENFTRDNILYPDINAGLLWFSVLDDDTNFYLGGAYGHLSRPNLSIFEGSTEQLYSKITIHAGGQFRLSPKLALIPNVVYYKQGPSFQVNGGTSLRFLLGNSRRYYQAFQFGGWVRVANRVIYDTDAKQNKGTKKHIDAIVISTRFEYEDFGIGFSYDLNVSSLKIASNYNGAFEFSLVYKICGPEKRNVYCPRF